MAKPCNDNDNFRTAEASTKAHFKTNGLLDRYLNIPDGALNKFREENARLSQIARDRYGISGMLFAEEQGGTKALPNIQMFHLIDAKKGIFYPDNYYLRPGYLPKNPRPEFESIVVNEEQLSAERADIVFKALGDKFQAAFGIPYAMVSEEEATMILENSQTPYEDQAGFYYADKIYFVKGKATMSTALHEYAHPFIKTIAIKNPKLFENLFTKLASSDTGQNIIAQLVSENKLEPETDRFKEEALIRAMEIDAQQKLGDIIKDDNVFKDFINMLMYAIKKIMSSMTKLVKPEKIKASTTLESLTDMMLLEDFEFETIKFNNTDFAEFASEFDELLSGLQQSSAKGLQEALNRSFTEARFQLIQLENAPWRLKEELVSIGGQKFLRAIRDHVRRYQTVSADLSEISAEEIIDAMEKQQEEFKIRGIALINSMAEAKVFSEKIEEILQNMEKNRTHLTSQGIAKVQFFAQYLERQKLFIDDLEKILAKGRDNSFIKELRDIKGIIRDALDLVKQLKMETVTEVFVDNTEFLQEEMERKITKRIKDVAKLDNLSEAKTNELVDKIINNPDGKTFSIDLSVYPLNPQRAKALVNEVKEYYFKRLNREAIEKYIKGEVEDLSFFEAWITPYMSMDDPVGSFVRYMKTKLSKAESKSLSQANTIGNRLVPLLQAVNYNANDTGQLGRMLLQTDKVGYTNASGEFEEYEIYSFKDKFINYRADQAKLKHDFEKARESGDKNAIRSALQAIWEFEEKYMHRKYKQEYYDLQKIWKQENVVRDPISGIDVKASAQISADAFLERQAALDKMNQYKYEAYTEMDDLYQFTESDAAKAEYEQLYQVTNPDGTNKTGDDLLKVLVRRKYRAESKKFYEYSLNEERVQKDYSNYVQELAARGITKDGSTADQWKKEMKRFVDKNFRVAYSDEYYRYKEELFDKLKVITTRYPSPVATELNDLYQERWRLSVAITDKNGTTNALQYTNAVLERIKDIEEEIVRLQDRFDASTGLSAKDLDKLKMYDAMVAEGDQLTDEEEAEYARLISSKNNIGMPAAVFNEYKKILKEIQGLTDKIPTEYYMAAFYEALGDTEVSEVLTMENADEWINSQDLYSALQSNDRFREWFLRNHFEKKGYNPKTKRFELRYYRTKAWTNVVPSNSAHYKTTVLNDPITGDPIVIKGVPAGRYYNQKLKKQWRTGYNAKTGKIELKVGEEIDNKGNFLPRTDAADKKYLNPEYFSMDKNSAEFKLLEAVKEEYLKIQDKKPNSSKLYLDLARFRQRANLELVQSGKAKEDLGSKLESVSDFMKSLFVKKADDPETTPGFNVDTEAYYIETDLQGQPISRIPVRGLYKLKKSEVSQDVLRSLYTYLHSLNEQEALIKEEPIAQAIKDVFGDPDNAIKKMNAASKNIHKNTGKLALLNANTNRRAQALNYFIDKTWYGQQYSAFEQENPMVTKIANVLMRNASRSFIAMDMVSALKNRFGIVIQNSIEAAAGTYYNPMSFAKGRAWSATAMIEMQKDIYAIGPKGLKMQLIERFDPIPGKTAKDFGKSTSRTFIKDFFDGSWMYDPRRFMEVEGSLQVFGGMMYFQKVEQKQPDGTTKQIDYIDAWEIDQDTKQLKLKEGIDPEWSFETIEHTFAAGDTFESLSKRYNVSVEELQAKNKVKSLKDFEPGNTVIISKAGKFTNLKLQIQGVGKRLNGMMEDIEGPQAEQYLGYRMFTFYKRYATQMFLNRFQADMSKNNRWGHVYNWDLGTTTRGYYIEAVGAAIKFLKHGMAYMPMMTAEEKAAFRKVVTEGMIIMIMALAVSLLFGYDPGDEDRFKKMKEREDEFGALGWLANHTLYQLITVSRENRAFVSPQEWLQYGDVTSIAFGPTVKLYLKILSDLYYMATGDEKAVYKSDVGPYPWQMKDEDGTYDYKLWNHLFSVYGIKGKNFSPIYAIKNNEAFENLR
jgi:hypothetical protein